MYVHTFEFLPMCPMYVYTDVGSPAFDSMRCLPINTFSHTIPLAKKKLERRDEALALAKEAVRRAQESVSRSQTTSDAEIAQAKSEARQSHTQATLLGMRLKESNGLCKHAELAQVECERVLREMGEELDEWGKELEECCSDMSKELEDLRCQLRDLGQGSMPLA
jgi:chromosome segregation ATPase